MLGDQLEILLSVLDNLEAFWGHCCYINKLEHDKEPLV